MRIELSPLLNLWSIVAVLLSASVTLAQEAPAADAPDAAEPAQAPSAAPPEEALVLKPAPDWSKPPSSGEPVQAPISPGRRALGLGASVVPGLLVHGAGHMAAGRVDDGLWLLAMEGTGLLMLVGGIAGLAAFGAPPELNPPLIWTATTGTGLFFFSWLADIYGVAAMDGQGAGAPFKLLPSMYAAQGYQYVYNPVMRDRHYLRTEAGGALGSWMVNGKLWWAPPDGLLRMEGRLDLRLLGATQSRAATDGSALDVRAGYDFNQVPDQDTSAHVVSLALRGRLDLARVLESARGAFVEAELGQAWASYRYALRTSEFNSLLLSRVSFGMYLGHDPGGYGELSVSYDHRHDGFIGGTKMNGLGSGVGGGFVTRLRKSVWGGWGLDMGFGAGSAYVADASVIYMWGGER